MTDAEAKMHRAYEIAKYIAKPIRPREELIGIVPKHVHEHPLPAHVRERLAKDPDYKAAIQAWKAAGDESMEKAGRTRWNQEDHNAAYQAVVNHKREVTT